MSRVPLLPGICLWPGVWSGKDCSIGQLLLYKGHNVPPNQNKQQDPFRRTVLWRITNTMLVNRRCDGFYLDFPECFGAGGRGGWLAQSGPQEDVVLPLVVVTGQKLLLLSMEQPHHIPLRENVKFLSTCLFEKYIWTKNKLCQRRNLTPFKTSSR